MKKLISLLSCSVLFLSAVACSNDESSSAPSLPSEIISSSTNSSTPNTSTSATSAILNENALEFITLNEPSKPFVLSIGDTYNGMTFESLVYTPGTDTFISANFTGEMTLTGTIQFGERYSATFFPDEESTKKVPMLSEYAKWDDFSLSLVTDQSYEELLKISTSQTLTDAINKAYETSDFGDSIPCTIKIDSFYSVMYLEPERFINITSITE